MTKQRTTLSDELNVGQVNAALARVSGLGFAVNGASGPVDPRPKPAPRKAGLGLTESAPSRGYQGMYADVNGEKAAVLDVSLHVEETNRLVEAIEGGDFARIQNPTIAEGMSVKPGDDEHADEMLDAEHEAFYDDMVARIRKFMNRGDLSDEVWMAMKMVAGAMQQIVNNDREQASEMLLKASKALA